jgi:hypothetical protein
MRTSFFFLGAFMVLWPVVLFLGLLYKGYLLVSVPLFLMFLAGLLALRLSYHWNKIE